MLNKLLYMEAIHIKNYEICRFEIIFNLLTLMATKVEEAYQKYLYYHNNHPVIHSNRFDILPKSEFLHKICNDEQFYKDWGNGCLGDLPPTSKKVKHDITTNATSCEEVEEPLDFATLNQEFEIENQVIKKISRWALFKLHLYSIKYRICKRLGLDKNSRTT
jgi:hypothetical protein